MMREPAAVDISHLPELVRLAEEVRRSNKPRMLQRAGEDIALLVPVPPRTRRRAGKKLSKEDIEAFLSSAGSWADVDVDSFIAQIYEDRRRWGDRPPVEL